MKIQLAIGLFFITASRIFGQQAYDSIAYFNQDMCIEAKETATLVAYYKLTGGNFTYTLHNTIDGKKRGWGMVSGKGKAKGGFIKEQIFLYENGALKDSVFWDNDSKIIFFYRFFPNGTLEASWTTGEGDNVVQKAFDEKGNSRTDYIFYLPAELPGGTNSWNSFIAKNLNPNIPIDNGAPRGIYKVEVFFLVNKDGYVSNIKLNTNNGYGLEQAVLQVIKKTGKWVPEILMNNIVCSWVKKTVNFAVR